MSDKDENQFLANLSTNSSLILSGRSASTPIESSKVSTTSLERNFLKSGCNSKMALNFVTPEIEYATVPLFGRRNLQLLSNCPNEPAGVVSEAVAGFSLEQKEDNVESLFEPNVEVTLPDNNVKKNSKKRSSAVFKITSSFKRDTKKILNKKKLQDSTNKVPSTCKSISARKTTVTTKKRRSNHKNDNQIPVFKVTPKCPKSPRLLTAIKAKINHRRESLGISPSKILVKESHVQTDKKKSAQKPGIGSSTCAESKVKKDRIVMKGTEPQLKKAHVVKVTKSAGLSNVVVKNSVAVADKSKIRKPSGTISKHVLNHANEQGDDSKKLRVFKATPIRKYSPVKPVKRLQITIPESPKLGKRRRLQSCPR